MAYCPNCGAMIKPQSLDEIVDNIRRYCPDADGFTISGGEPFISPGNLRSLVRSLLDFSDDIIIFTGYRLDELREMNDDDVNYILDNIGVLVDGPFVEELNDGRGLRGSSNQNISIFKNHDLYCGLEEMPRTVQIVVNNDIIMTIGIPAVNSDDQQ